MQFSPQLARDAAVDAVVIDHLAADEPHQARRDHGGMRGDGEITRTVGGEALLVVPRDPFPQLERLAPGRGFIGIEGQGLAEIAIGALALDERDGLPQRLQDVHAFERRQVGGMEGGDLGVKKTLGLLNIGQRKLRDPALARATVGELQRTSLGRGKRLHAHGAVPLRWIRVPRCPQTLVERTCGARHDGCHPNRALRGERVN